MHSSLHLPSTFHLRCPVPHFRAMTTNVRQNIAFLLLLGSLGAKMSMIRSVGDTRYAGLSFQNHARRPLADDSNDFSAQTLARPMQALYIA